MSTTVDTHVGSPRNRVDGRLKVTGAAKYAAEFTAPDLLYGYVVSSAVGQGPHHRASTPPRRWPCRAWSQVFTHENRPHIPAWR